MDISVADLACARRGIAVLEGVRFTVRAGAALVLRGPNGIGKTTLLRTIAGLQPPLSGEVSAPADAVAYAAHADGVKAPLTVAENLRFWARVCGTGDIARPLAAYDLDGLADRRAADLSAGQKRRLGLARMLVTGRPIWLFDEPTVSLDTAGSALFARAVEAHLAARGVALIATHADPGIAAATLDLAGFRARPREVPGFDRAFA